MYCYSLFEIGMFGSSYFVGYLVTGFIMQFISKIGRKKPIIIGASLRVLWCLGIQFIKNQYVRYLGIFLIRATNFSYLSAYLLLTEVIPKKHLAFSTTFFMVFDGITNNLVASLYFYLISINWIYLFYFQTVVLVLPAPFLALWLPESPKVLYEKKQFDQEKSVIK
jgi:MFS family permease